MSATRLTMLPPIRLATLSPIRRGCTWRLNWAGVSGSWAHCQVLGRVGMGAFQRPVSVPKSRQSRIAVARAAESQAGTS